MSVEGDGGLTRDCTAGLIFPTGGFRVVYVTVLICVDLAPRLNARDLCLVDDVVDHNGVGVDAQTTELVDREIAKRVRRDPCGWHECQTHHHGHN